MKTNDPRLTGFVLGELDAEDSRLVKDALHVDKAIAKEVKAIEQSVDLVANALGSPQPKLSAEQRKKIFSASETETSNITPFPDRKSRMGLAVALTGAAAVAVAVFSLKNMNSNGYGVANFDAFSTSALSQRMGLSAEPWDDSTTTKVALPAASLQAAVSQNPIAYRKKSTELNIPVTSVNRQLELAQHSPEIEVKEQNSVTLPLTCGNLSWKWIQEAHTNHTAISKGIVRTEELANAVHLPLTHEYTFKGVTTSLEFAKCPWDNHSLLAVIQIENKKSSVVSDVSAGLSVSSSIKSFQVLGYGSSTNDTLLAPATLNLEPNFRHTVICQLDFNQLPSDQSSAVSLHLKVGENQQSIAYDYSKAALAHTSSASHLPIATSFWSHWATSDSSVQASVRPALLQYLHSTKEQISGKKATSLCEALIALAQ